ncbi:hypothetical protein [Coleofasciculus sp. H7-2]|uniref:hypothetical protein n=1 Tax=Coleofasciculus sp. H7-2 TaxID=3351545 RepID=UPI00366D7AA0
MSKHKKNSSSGSKSARQEFAKEPTVSPQKQTDSAQESVISSTLPLLSALQEGSINVTFAAAMQEIQVETLSEVLQESFNKIEEYVSKVKKLYSQLSQQNNRFQSAGKIINRINLLIDTKAAVAEILAWMSVVVNIVDYLVFELGEQLSNDTIRVFIRVLSSIIITIDMVLTGMPDKPAFGITLTPDQKQVSETKSRISDLLSRLEKINQENEEASKDWGRVEQNAYERILEGSTKNVSGEEFLSWLSDLEQGCDV